MISRPQLRSAPQFVGIAGVMAGEHIAEDDSERKKLTLNKTKQKSLTPQSHSHC
jgi:hypothetical protein